MTAFVTPWGLYEWVGIPFGLSNAPSAFQRSMEKMLENLQDEGCIPYLDDAFCYGKSFKDHNDGVRQFLRALQPHGVKLRPTKCELLKHEVRHVGKLASAEGVRIKIFGAFPEPHGIGPLPTLGHDELVKAQREDPATGAPIKLKETKGVLSHEDRRGAHGPLQKPMHEWRKVHIRNTQRQQLVLPTKYQAVALKHLFDDMGHVQTERVFTCAYL